MNYLTLGIDNMIRALFSSRLEITFLLDGLESRSAKLQIIELARYPFFRVTYLTLLVLLAHG